jgi:hypothetical protein
MPTLSNNYKNSLKKLRRNNLPSCKEELKKEKNYYKYLTELEDQEDIKNESTEIVREKFGIDFNDLPEDTIYMILEFLPCNTRLAILKHKYNKSFIKNMINKIPKSVEGLTKAWKCADLAVKLIESLGLLDNRDIYNNLSTYYVSLFKAERNPELYSIWYKEGFLKIILTALKHYTKIYNNKTQTREMVIYTGYYGEFTIIYRHKTTHNKKVIEHIEQIMLHMFARIAKIK